MMHKLNFISNTKFFKSLSLFPRYYHSIKYGYYYMYLNDDNYNIIIHNKIDSKNDNNNYNNSICGQLSLNKNEILKRTLRQISKTNTIQNINERRFSK